MAKTKTIKDSKRSTDASAHDLEFAELRAMLSVFSHWQTRSVIRERYASFVCSACKSLDMRKAYAAGIDPAFAARIKKLKVDAFITHDLQSFVSQPLFDFLDKEFPSLFRGVPVPDTKYVALLPRRPVELKPGSPKPGRDSMYRTTRPMCKVCKRYPETLQRVENVYLPRRAHLMGLASRVQSGPIYVATTTWVVDDTALEQITRRKWKGLKVTQGFFGKSSPFHAKARREQAAQTPENNSWLKLLKDSGMKWK